MIPMENVVQDCSNILQVIDVNFTNNVFTIAQDSQSRQKLSRRKTFLKCLCEIRIPCAANPNYSLPDKYGDTKGIQQ